MEDRSQKGGWFRRLASFFSSNEPAYELADEDLETFGTIVMVVQDVDPDHSQGRIDLRGSTWNAMSVSEPIPAGERARVLYRDNLVWVVEKYFGVV
jgi:membrane protein implicated in regulation of membrane protease activity